MEFDHFIDEGVLKRNEEFDILAWWKNNGLKYHIFTKDCKRYFSHSCHNCCFKICLQYQWETIKSTPQQASSQDYGGNDVCLELVME